MMSLLPFFWIAKKLKVHPSIGSGWRAENAGG